MGGMGGGAGGAAAGGADPSAMAGAAGGAPPGGDPSAAGGAPPAGGVSARDLSELLYERDLEDLYERDLDGSEGLWARDAYEQGFSHGLQAREAEPEAWAYADPEEFYGY